MKIEQSEVLDVLQLMRDFYPQSLLNRGYNELIKKLGNQEKVDGYLLYLSDNELIEVEMGIKLRRPDDSDTNKNYTSWQVNTLTLRINAAGLDLLDSKNI